jgi:FkbM family methyltransferase
MSVILNDITGKPFELTKNPLFIDHYNNHASFARVIIDQMNVQNIYSEILQNERDIVAFDCGANVGLFSVYLASICKDLYSFEPTPAHFAVFEKFVEVFDLKNVHPQQKAISTVTGEITFNIHPHNSTMNSIIRERRTDNLSLQAITVPCVTFSDFMDQNNIDKVDFIKLDIEGFETKLITDPSFPDCISRVKQFFIEVHDFERMGYNTPLNFTKITNVFKKHGRNVRRVNHDALIVD